VHQAFQAFSGGGFARGNVTRKLSTKVSGGNGRRAFQWDVPGGNV